MRRFDLAAFATVAARLARNVSLYQGSGRFVSALLIVFLALFASSSGAAGAEMPDNRAYELVSPANTNSIFLGSLSEKNNFSTSLGSLDGNSVIFNSEGSLPGLEGNGTINGYQAIRGENGWTTRAAGPSGAHAVSANAGGTSPEHEFSFWFSGTNGGSLDLGPTGANYLRDSDGNFELLGHGSLGDDLRAEGRWIAPGASHVIFTGSAVQLEPKAPPPTKITIYDRSPGGPTKVVSLLPGDITPTVNATYLGTSADGSAVVFTISGTLYERRDNATTLQIAAGTPTLQGISANGGRVFYKSSNNLFAFDAGTQTITPIGSGGASTMVNVSADGSRAYFSSTQQLVSGKGELGGRNLYVWDGTAVRFIAVLAAQDFVSFSGSSNVSLARWTEAVSGAQTSERGPAQDPSRTNPDGSVFVFQSHGIVGYPYNSEGFSEVYRYDDDDGSLTCLSCRLAPATGASSEAEMESTRQTVLGAPNNNQSRIQNVTDDGTTVFFQSREALVPEDTDGLNDVYQWKEGRVSLISSGRSGADDFLYGMTPDGHDVFFKTGDALVPRDESGGSGSIYDARVGGGFSEPVLSEPCSLEGSCQGPGTSQPGFPFAGSTVFVGPSNPSHHRHKKKHQKKKHRAPRKASRNHGGAK